MWIGRLNMARAMTSYVYDVQHTLFANMTAHLEHTCLMFLHQALLWQTAPDPDAMAR